MFKDDLKPMFNGCVMMNNNAIKDAAVMAMLESQQSQGWPSSSGFGNHQTFDELIGCSPRFNSQDQLWYTLSVPVAVLVPRMSTLKECRHCKELKPLESFPFFSTNTAGRKNTCTSCSNDLSKVRRKLRKDNPPPPAGNCPSCGRFTEAWVLDHCHYTDEFRGYVCNSCNLGFGQFNDDPVLMLKAITYLLQ